MKKTELKFCIGTEKSAVCVSKTLELGIPLGFSMISILLVGIGIYLITKEK